MNQRKKTKRILWLCIILILVLVMVIGGLRILESTNFFGGQGTVDPSPSKTIVRDGIKYYPRQDITVFLFLWLAQPEAEKTDASYGSDRAVEMVSLLIFDETNETCRILMLNRDTMMDIPVLDSEGRPSGTAYQQLAQSYSYGAGEEESCENTKQAVSSFLYDLAIDHYLAMNMDAVVEFNDAIGGVTVTVTDDFSEVDPTILMGAVRLQGQQVISFVSTPEEANGLYASRMDRQQEYMLGFLNAVQSKRGDIKMMLSLLNQLSSQMMTDCSGMVMNDYLKRFTDFEVVEVVTPEGDDVLTEDPAFYVDEEKLDELILRLFYAPK